jgi:hypothetical protein
MVAEYTLLVQIDLAIVTAIQQLPTLRMQSFKPPWKKLSQEYWRSRNTVESTDIAGDTTARFSFTPRSERFLMCHDQAISIESV